MLHTINKHQLRAGFCKRTINNSLRRFISSNNNSSAISEATVNSEVGTESAMINEKITKENRDSAADKSDTLALNENTTDKDNDIKYTSKYKSFPSYKNLDKRNDALKGLYEYWKMELPSVAKFDLFSYRFSPLTYLASEGLEKKEEYVEFSPTNPNEFTADFGPLKEEMIASSLYKTWLESGNAKSVSKLPKHYKLKLGELHKIELYQRNRNIQEILQRSDSKRRQKQGIEGSHLKVFTANARIVNKEKGASMLGMGKFEDWEKVGSHIKPKDYIFRKPTSHIRESQKMDLEAEDLINDKQMSMINILSGQKGVTSKPNDPMDVFQHFVSTTLNQEKNLISRVKRIQGRKRYTLRVPIEDEEDD